MQNSNSLKFASYIISVSKEEEVLHYPEITGAGAFVGQDEKYSLISAE